MTEAAILPAERRRAIRTEVRLPVSLARPGLAAAGEAENVSMSGILVRLSLDLPVWARFTVTLPGAGARDVRIVRRDGDRYGCLFQTPLEPEEMDAVLESEEARAGFDRLQAEADAPPAPEPKRRLRLWRR